MNDTSVEPQGMLVRSLAPARSVRETMQEVKVVQVCSYILWQVKCQAAYKCFTKNNISQLLSLSIFVDMNLLMICANDIAKVTIHLRERYLYLRHL